MQSAPRKQRESGVFKEVWRAHNTLIDFCREIAPMPSGNLGVVVNRTSNGTMFRADASKTTESGVVFRAKILQDSPDFFSAIRVDSSGEDVESVEATILVGKPYVLRGESPRSVIIQTRVLSESVYPEYAVGDYVTVSRTEGDTYQWIDLTVGRSWRLDMRQVAVCISGDDNWRILIAASNPFRP